jgi:hypothetical protein
VIRQAFELWATQTPLKFTEVSSDSSADIVIGWASGDHGDGDPFDGPGDVLAHASFPNPYDDSQVSAFDDDERWVDSERVTWICSRSPRMRSVIHLDLHIAVSAMR